MFFQLKIFHLRVYYAQITFEFSHTQHKEELQKCQIFFRRIILVDVFSHIWCQQPSIYDRCRQPLVTALLLMLLFLVAYSIRIRKHHITYGLYLTIINYSKKCNCLTITSLVVANFYWANQMIILVQIQARDHKMCTHALVPRTRFVCFWNILLIYNMHFIFLNFYILYNIFTLQVATLYWFSSNLVQKFLSANSRSSSLAEIRPVILIPILGGFPKNLVYRALKSCSWKTFSY